MSMEELSQLKKYGLSRVDELLDQLPLPIVIIIAEELREAIKNSLREARVEEATESRIIRDRVIDSVFELLNISGSGKIRELMLITDSPEFNIYVELDNKPIINHSFTELQQLSEIMEEIDAFEKNGLFVFRATNLYFTEKCKVIVKPAIKITIKHGFILFNLF